MDDEKNEKVKDENTEENVDDNRKEENVDDNRKEENVDDNLEEENVDDNRDEVYVNDDEIEMLRSIEKKFGVLEDKIDNMISMYVDSGAIIQDSVDEITEQEREDYEDDFINIDSMDLSI